MLPILLNMIGRQAVVIGGGAVGRRKADVLLAADALVRVVCLEPRPIDAEPRIEWRTEAFRGEHLEDAVLVFAAATPDVNRVVVEAAQARGLWVNSADDPEAGDFVLPAVHRQGGLTLAVGTAGASPLLARTVRDRLAADFDEAFAGWVELLAELRPLVVSQFEAERKRAVLERLCQWDWLERIRREGVAAVRVAMQAEVRALASLPRTD